MKIFTGSQIREIDKYTIENEPISSLDLMERAARMLTAAITEEWDASHPVVVFAGPGNNGGDALAVARMLADRGYDVAAWLFNIGGKLSPDCTANKERLEKDSRVRKFAEITSELNPPELSQECLVVDGLFGSGLSRPLTGGFARLVKYINASSAHVVSIDVPSGLMTEDNSDNVSCNIVRAHLTLTLQNPKLAFFFAENQQYIGRVKVLDIRLSPKAIDDTDAFFSVVEQDEVSAMLRRRNPFAHKGDMGSALLIAGSYGMAGAAILASRACLRSGVGKLTVHVPRLNNAIMQIAVPEAVVHLDAGDTVFSEPVDTEPFKALGIGPGLGQDDQTAIALITQLRRSHCPVVADADALNILGNRRSWLQQLPKGIIMTPHPKELDRLTDANTNSSQRLASAIELARKIEGYVVVKGHYTAICLPDGHVLFSPTGNAGMATAGSGDVLTGILTALLARGYQEREACVLGVYLHGLAGDLGAAEIGMESLTAGDIIRFLPKAFLCLEQRR